MDKHLVEQLIKKLQEFDGPIDDLADLIDQISDEDERLRFRSEFGEAMGRLAGLSVLLVRQYPDLDPDKDLVFEEDDPLRWRPNPGNES